MVTVFAFISILYVFRLNCNVSEWKVIYRQVERSMKKLHLWYSWLNQQECRRYTLTRLPLSALFTRVSPEFKTSAGSVKPGANNAAAAAAAACPALRTASLFAPPNEPSPETLLQWLQVAPEDEWPRQGQQKSGREVAFSVWRGGVLLHSQKQTGLGQT